MLFRSFSAAQTAFGEAHPPDGLLFKEKEAWKPPPETKTPGLMLEYGQLRPSHVVSARNSHAYHDLTDGQNRGVASAPRCDPRGEPACAARKSRTPGHLRSQNSNSHPARWVRNWVEFPLPRKWKYSDTLTRKSEPSHQAYWPFAQSRLGPYKHRWGGRGRAWDGLGQLGSCWRGA